MKKALLAIFLAVSAHAAGTVQQSISQLGTTNNWVLAFRWTGDATTGTIPVVNAQLQGCCTGYLFSQVETVPGATTAPTAGYSVQIQDSAGVDILAGAAVSLSATAAQSFAAATTAPPLQGTFSLVITGQSVNSATGVVFVFLAKPGQVNAALIGKYLPTISGGAHLNVAFFGATCDGVTNNNGPIQAAIATGAAMNPAITNIDIPGNCVWIVPGGIIPGGTNGIEYWGGNWITTIIKSASNPATLALQYAAGVHLHSFNLQGSTVNSPTNCPVGEAINATQETQQIITTCYSSWDSFGGQNNVDRTAIFFKDGAFNNGISGDASNNSNCAGLPNHPTYPVNATTGGCLYTGNSLRADNYAGAGGLSAILATDMPGAATAAAIISTVNFTGSGSGVAQSPSHISMFDQYRTTGSMFQVNTRAATYSGNMIEADLADISGSFTGNYLDFTNGETLRVVADYAGDIYVRGTIGSTPVNVAVTNGNTNENLNISGAGLINLTGGTGAFAIGGIVAPVSGTGQLTIYNTLAETMTLNYLDASSTAANRIYNTTGANISCPHANCLAQLQYINGQWSVQALI